MRDGVLLPTVDMEDLSDWHRLSRDLRDAPCGHQGGTGSVSALSQSILGAKLKENEVG